MPDQNDFYVGYQKTAPPRLAAWVRKILAIAALVAVAVPLLLVASQQRFADSVFEFGNVQEFEGRLSARPYPIIHVDGAPHLLVEYGKRGARERLAELDGQTVHARGQLIYRGTDRMIELSADEVVAAGAAAPPGEVTSLGRYDLVGEILDSKCYLGVMKPGRGKAHRSCAARCISGGVPPILIVTDRQGEELHLLMASASGDPVGAGLLELVAEAVEVTGEIVRRDGLLYLYADEDAYGRAPSTEGGA